MGGRGGLVQVARALGVKAPSSLWGLTAATWRFKLQRSSDWERPLWTSSPASTQSLEHWGLNAMASWGLKVANSV